MRFALTRSFTLAALLWCAGCSSSTTTAGRDDPTPKADAGRKDGIPEAKTGQVEGFVTFKGVPLTSGTVTFHPEKSASVSGMVAADGRYAVAGVPPGNAVVTVESAPGPDGDGPTPEAKGPKGKPSFRGVQIPQKYANKDTSPLRIEVREGKQPFNIEIAP